MELGKYDMLNGGQLDMSVFHRGVTFHGIDLDLTLTDLDSWKEVTNLRGKNGY